MKRYLMYLLCLCSLIACASPRYTATTPVKPEIGGPISTLTANSLEKFVNAGYQQTELKCAVFLETSWGSEAEAWGDPIGLPARSRTVFPPPTFGSNGEVYITDLTNHRILVYDGQSHSLIQTITLPEQYYADPESGTPMIPWEILVTPTQILVPHGFNKVGLLSLEGKQLKDIQLPYRFNPMAPVKKPLWTDSKGGLLLIGEKVAYFDKGWEDGNWKELSSGTDFIVNPYSWDDQIIGQSGVQFNIVSFRVETKNDFLKMPIKINTGLNPNGNLSGIDRNGLVYLGIPVDSSYAFARYGIENRLKQYGYITEVDSSQIIQSAVSPNGEIYLIVYSPTDQSIPPKMMKCDFPS